MSRLAMLALLGLLDPTWLVQLVTLLHNPFIATILLSVGLLGLLVEIKAGAHGVGLLTGLISFGLFFAASVLLGLAGWPVIILLALGLMGVFIEVLPVPTFGVAGFLGLLALGASIVMALTGQDMTSGNLLQAFGVLGASLVITFSVVYAWVRHLPNSTRFAGLIHQTSSAGALAAPARDDLVGSEGTALTDLRPSGLASVGSERIDVVSEGEYIPSGSRVRVVRADGYRHVVRKASEK